jgi:23S rRNA pseudouridine1911/1915/1917 synthase
MTDIQSGTLTVPAELAGMRLDRALVRLLEGVSRVRIQELIADGGVLVEGCPGTKAQAVEEGWTLELREVPRSRIRPGGPDAIELVVIYEDDHLVIIDKPAGIVSHPSTVVRGGTLSERAVERFGPLPAPQGEDRPGIVHRLDADTSGLIVLAKTEEAAAGLVTLFKERRVKKEYQALVFGSPRFDSDWIEGRIGRTPKRADRMMVVPEDEGRDARTFYETRERFAHFAHIVCRPETGRTHQIRVHLASIEHPLVGDRIYKGRRGLSIRLPREAPPLKRHALHASGLAFTHPVTGEALSFESPLPEDMQAFLDWLRVPGGD